MIRVGTSRCPGRQREREGKSRASGPLINFEKSSDGPLIYFERSADALRVELN